MKCLLSKGHGNPFCPFTDNVEGITVKKMKKSHGASHVM